MEDEEQYPHLVRKETRTSSPAKEISSLHNTHDQNKVPTDERESSVSMSIIIINLPNPKRLRH
jgi:hypothetical protein